MRKATVSDLAFNALGDATRRLIFEKLKAGPLSVAQISDGLSVSRPAVSQHLAVLKQAGLISSYQEGTRRICSLNEEGIVAMRDYIDKFWGAALELYREHAASKLKLQQELDDPGHWY